MERYKIRIPKSREELAERVYNAILEEGKRKILIYGESGSGRSVLLDYICRKLENNEKKVFRVLTSLGGILDAVKNVKKFDVFVIDDIDIILESDIQIDDLMLDKLVKEIDKNNKVLIIACEERNLKKMKEIMKFDSEYKIESVSFEELKEILESLWGENFKLFTEKDLKKIYDNSKGNLKMAYLLSTIIYTEKRKRK